MSDYAEVIKSLRDNEFHDRMGHDVCHIAEEAADAIETLIRERDEALAREAEWFMRYQSTVTVQQRGYATAIEEAAAVAKDFGLPVSEELNMALTYRQKNISEAILALKERPIVREYLLSRAALERKPE
jgi:hypothetical protein